MCWMMWSARGKSLAWESAATLELGSIIASVPKKLVFPAEEVINWKVFVILQVNI